jgi:hypothetical protein
MAFWGYMMKCKRYLHILQFPHITDDWNEIDRMEESLVDCGKYIKYWKFYTTYFLKFTTLPKIRQQKSLFFSSKKRQFSNSV